MSTALIIIKDADRNQTNQVDFSNDLEEGVSIDSAAVTQIVPVTTPPLVASITGVDGTGLSFATEGGQSNVTYNVQVEVNTDEPATFNSLFAVSVRDYVHSDVQTRNPDAFAALVDSIEAGESAVGRFAFLLPAGTNTTNAVATWQLVDSEGGICSQGNAYNYIITNTSFATKLEAEAVIHAPSDLIPTLMDQAYQIRWELAGLSSTPSYGYESIKVLGRGTEPQGVADAVELKGDLALLTVVLPDAYEEVGVEVFQQDVLVKPWVRATEKEKTTDGWLYGYRLSTADFPVSLDPYSVIWRYRNVSTPNSPVFRETGKLFIVSPMILTAVDDCRAMVSKARTTTTGMPDVLFETSTILTWMRRGRDFFNAASGLITSFTMTRAAGALREFWLGYSEVAMLQSQYLAEGEKAFDWSGGAISLNRDVTQFYQTLADSKLSRLDNDVKGFKQSLLKKGLEGGDGNINASASRSVGKVGITLTPVTHHPYRRPLALR